jgi:hypothetical protein
MNVEEDEEALQVNDVRDELGQDPKRHSRWPPVHADVPSRDSAEDDWTVVDQAGDDEASNELLDTPDLERGMIPTNRPGQLGFLEYRESVFDPPLDRRQDYPAHDLQLPVESRIPAAQPRPLGYEEDRAPEWQHSSEEMANLIPRRRPLRGPADLRIDMPSVPLSLKIRSQIPTELLQSTQNHRSPMTKEERSRIVGRARAENALQPQYNASF